MNIFDLEDIKDLESIRNTIQELQDKEQYLLDFAKRKLKDSNNISTFLDVLNLIKDRYLIILSVKDTPGNLLSNGTIQKIHNLGFTNFSKELWRMYVGVSYKGEILFNKVGEKVDAPVAYKGTIPYSKCNIEALSMSWKNGNVSVIKINNINFSINIRGINIVVFDTKNNELIDTIGYDHHFELKTFSRSIDINSFKNNEFEKCNTKLDKILDAINLNKTQFEIYMWNMYKNNGESVLEAKKRFFKNLDWEDENLKLIQEASDIILKEFGRICKKYNVDYWIDFGTLIGSVRHSGFVPWDDDIDVCMVRKDIPKLQECLKNEDTFVYLDRYWYVSSSDIVEIYRMKFKEFNPYVFVDIFIFDYCNTDNMNTTWKHYREIRKQFINLKNKFKFREGRIRDDEEITSILEKNRQEFNNSQNIVNDKGNALIWGIENYSFFSQKIGIMPIEQIFPLNQYLTFNNQNYLAPNKFDKHLFGLYGDIYSLPKDILSHKHISREKDAIESCKKVIELYKE